jgi:ribonuclease D
MKLCKASSEQCPGCYMGMVLLRNRIIALVLHVSPRFGAIRSCASQLWSDPTFAAITSGSPLSFVGALDHILGVPDSMSHTTPAIEDDKITAKEAAKDKARWPLDYKLQAPKRQGQPSLQAFGFDSSVPAKKCWWSYRLYKNADNKLPEILYSKTKADSEAIVKQFLDEPVVGFDMEWPWNDWKKSELQNKIGLIQIASESKIALIHIGLHTGKTTDDIIAPSLKKLIEDPKIGKLGVGILSADFARLRRFFHLKPRGAVELSHLYRLVKFGGYKPELVSTKMVSLARLVEDQLGHPLYKGDVRTSNWSKPLSRDQINYAAGDAYAGYMLYHCINYKRLQMKPSPPMPIHAETYLTYKLSGIIPLRLDQKTKDGTLLTSETFFGVTMSDKVSSSSIGTKEKKAPATPKPKAPTVPKELTDAASQALYNELVLRRAALAEKAGVQPYRVTTSPVLVALALQRPTDKDQLLAVKGIGAKQYETYGHAWLEVISSFLERDGLPALVVDTESITSATTALDASKYAAAAEPPSTPVRPSRRAPNRDQDSPDSSPAFGSPVQRTPQLHTGLSFTMAESKIDAEEQETDHDSASVASDESLPSLDFGDTPSLATPRLKRKRTESPAKEASQRLHQMTQARDSLPTVLPEAITTPKKPVPVVQPVLEGFTPRTRLARNKLSAFSKLVARKLPPRSSNAPPIVSERSLSLIVIRRPQTMDDLERIPGVDGLILACEQTGTDLLKNILKFERGVS